MLQKILLIVALLFSFPVCARELLQFDNSKVSMVGIYIKDLRKNKVIASQNEYKVMTPASVTKSVTTAAAMLHLSPDFCFETAVDIVGDTVIHNGAITADIVIKSSGDPTLESSHFPEKRGFADAIALSLCKLGINKIIGNIIINDSLVNASGAVPTWQLEDEAWDYGAGLHPFNYMDNRFELVLNSDSILEIIPQIPNLFIENKLQPGDEENITIMRDGKNRIILTGTRAINTPQTSVGCAIPNPNELFIRDLKKAIATKHILLINDSIVTKKHNSKRLYTHHSPRRDEILRSLMVRSDNLFAESLLLAIAPNGDGTDSVKNILQNHGIDCELITLCDGSGLSRVDRLSPFFISQVYEYMYSSPYINEYVATFPKSGRDGTLKYFLANTRLQGKLALKTGSMGGVQCYGGYKLGRDGIPTHSVVIMVNNFFCKRAELRKAIERLLLQIF